MKAVITSKYIRYKKFIDWVFDIYIELDNVENFSICSPDTTNDQYTCVITFKGVRDVFIYEDGSCDFYSEFECIEKSKPDNVVEWIKERVK